MTRKQVKNDESHYLGYISTLLMLLSLGCAGSAGEPNSRPIPSARANPTTAPTTSSSSAPAASAVTAPALPTVQIHFDVILDKEKAGLTTPDAVYFEHLALEDALLVVVNMPAKAFLVRGTTVEPLPQFFAGLRSPAPEWPAEEFQVDSMSGDLGQLEFEIVAPSSGYQDHVRGTPGHFKNVSGKKSGATPTQPAWINPDTISVPFRTQRGAFIYEAMQNETDTAKQGFQVRFDGPAKGEKLPVPAAGKNGCRYAVAGHALFTQNHDGTLLGLGTLCTSGEQQIVTAKLNGVAPPFQSLGVRLGQGALVVERWQNGKSLAVEALPGAERVAEFAPFDFLRVPRGSDHLFLQSSVQAEKGNRFYLAEHDGKEWHDVTPPGADEFSSTFVSASDELYVLHQTKSFRRKADRWELIQMQARGECGKDAIYTKLEMPRGDLLLGGVGCLWLLPKDNVVARIVPLEEGVYLDDLFVYGSEVYGSISKRSERSFVRIRIE